MNGRPPADEFDSARTLRPGSFEKTNENAPVDGHDMDEVKTIRPAGAPNSGGRVIPSSVDVLPIGHVLDGHLIITRVYGRGSMGVVYRAIDSATQMEYAIKIIAPEAVASPESLLQLKRDVGHASSMTHQNLLGIKYFADSGPRKYIAMEDVDGDDLEALRLRHGGTLPLDVFGRIGQQMLAGLAYLQEHGVVHTNVRPGNIIVTHAGEAKVTDFWINRATMKDVSAQNAAQPITDGSLCCMAPEQLRAGESVDRRADVYAIGMVFYRLLTGCYPFDVANPQEIVRWHLDSAHRFDVAPLAEYAPVVGKALEVECGRRWNSCGDMLTAFNDVRLKSSRAPESTEAMRPSDGPARPGLPNAAHGTSTGRARGGDSGAVMVELNALADALAASGQISDNDSLSFIIVADRLGVERGAAETIIADARRRVERDASSTVRTHRNKTSKVLAICAIVLACVAFGAWGAIEASKARAESAARMRWDAEAQQFNGPPGVKTPLAREVERIADVEQWLTAYIRAGKLDEAELYVQQLRWRGPGSEINGEDRAVAIDREREFYLKKIDELRKRNASTK